MTIHRIPLETIAPKGKITAVQDGEGLRLNAKRVLDKNGSYAWLPSAYKLPFRMDMTLKANSSDFRWRIGKGYIHFSAPINCSGGGIRRADILTGKEEAPKHDYDCDVALGEFTNVSVVYGSRMTWVEIGGKCCYPTAKAPCGSEAFTDGLSIGIGCGRNVDLTIQSLTITEYEDGEPDIPAEIAGLPELTPFEWYVKSLPRELRDEAVKTDLFLLTDMKSSLKLRRSLDKYGNVTYASPWGFQYKMRKYRAGEQQKSDGKQEDVQHESGKHETGWIASWSSDSVKKPDYTSKILEKLSEESPNFANQMFAQLKVCNGITCKRNADIEFAGISKHTCGSSILHEWLPSAFADVRRVVAAAGEVAKALEEDGI